MNGEKTKMDGDGWGEFVRRANKLINSGELAKQETEFKLVLGGKVAAAREAVLFGSDSWSESTKKGLTGSIINGINQARIRGWINSSPEDALKALAALWTVSDLSVSKRITAFCSLFPNEILSGTGIRMNVVSVLLMGIDVKNYPPFMITRFEDAYRHTGFEIPLPEASEAALYIHALGFLDRLIEECRARGLNLRHRLDAQSLVWRLPKYLPKLGHSKPKTLQSLANDLLIDYSFLENIETMLLDKGQIIFQGPPGTGKTFVAQELARCLARYEDLVTLVQFHPSYAYEDFVRGFRPTLKDKQAGFAIEDGPLLLAAKKASRDEDAKHFLIIDEINRGNLAKIFGELYFLLEYRDKSIRMQYQKEGEKDFRLPNNLYIIGTMNTADRSIALVDLALRRRFYFVEFHPDLEPVKGVLRRWLLKNNLNDLEGVADVVDKANKLLTLDRHAAIGPSYFMKKGLDKRMVERIWKHSVLPYVEERLFGDEDRIEQFNLRALSEDIEHPLDWDDGEEQIEDEP